jgi:hypothetical protein
VLLPRTYLRLLLAFRRVMLEEVKIDLGGRYDDDNDRYDPAFTPPTRPLTDKTLCSPRPLLASTMWSSIRWPRARFSGILSSIRWWRSLFR